MQTMWVSLKIYRRGLAMFQLAACAKPHKMSKSVTELWARCSPRRLEPGHYKTILARRRVERDKKFNIYSYQGLTTESFSIDHYVFEMGAMFDIQATRG